MSWHKTEDVYPQSGVEVIGYDRGKFQFYTPHDVDGFGFLWWNDRSLAVWPPTWWCRVEDWADEFPTLRRVEDDVWILEDQGVDLDSFSDLDEGERVLFELVCIRFKNKESAIV